MKQKLLIPLLFICFYQSARSQNQDTTVWTLKQCIEYALANNLTVKRSALGVETSEINYLQSKLSALPSLNASASYGYNWGRSIDPGTNQFIEQRIKSINLNANSSLLLWNGFRLFNTVRQSDRDKEAADQDYIKAQNDVILNVITLYLNVVFNKELYANAQHQLNSTDQQLQRTRKLAEAGSVPQANVLNLEAQHATNELNQIQRENTLNLSLLQLKQALLLPASTNLDVEIPQIDISPSLVVDQSADEIYDVATANMPEVKSAKLKRQSSIYATKAAYGSMAPRLSLNGSISTIYSDARQEYALDGGAPFTFADTIGYVQGTNEYVFQDVTIPSGSLRTVSYKDQFKNNLSRSVGISLSIPIFNGYSSHASYQRSKISQLQAEISLTETEQRLRQSVETAFNDAIAATKTYQSSEKQVKARDEAFRMTKQRFDIGAVNYVEYQVAENDLFQAQSDLLRAKYDFIFKKKILDFYQGKPLEF